MSHIERQVKILFRYANLRLSRLSLPTYNHPAHIYHTLNKHLSGFQGWHDGLDHALIQQYADICVTHHIDKFSEEETTHV